MQSSLTKTQKQNSNIMQFECPHCEADRSIRGQPFTEKSLQHHIRKRHPAGTNEEAKPANVLTCEICACWKSRRGSPFMTEAELSRHRSVAHGKSSLAPRNKPSEDIATKVQPKKMARPPIDSIPVKFCPQCGCNVEVVAAALSIFG